MLVLGGCFYTRLLSLRDQLRDFDHHIIVAPEQDQHDLHIGFRDPVLLLADAERIAGAPSQRVAERPSEVQWTWSRAGIATVTEAVASATLDSEGRIVAVIIPRPVVAAFGRDLLLAMLRSGGRAKVDEQERSATATLGVAVAAPDAAQLAATLGPPDVSGDPVIWRWRERSGAAAELRVRFADGRARELTIQLPEFWFRIRLP